MNCPMERQGRPELLLDYCSGRLERGSALAVEEHIRGCAACRELVARQGAVWEALGSWEAAPVSADFDRSLYRRIQAGGSRWERWMRPFLVRQGLPIAAAAGLVVMAAVMLQGPGLPPAEPVPQSAQVEGLSADQLEHALRDMEMLRELNVALRPEAAEPRM